MKKQADLKTSSKFNDSKGNLELRISTGQFKNKRLIVAESSRPVRERVKLAVLSRIGLDAFEKAKVLDLFAGTGNLGFEALSIGAGECTFVEDDYDALGTIRQNAEKLGLTYSSKISGSSLNNSDGDNLTGEDENDPNANGETASETDNEFDNNTSRISEIRKAFLKSQNINYKDPDNLNGNSNRNPLLDKKVYVIKEDATKFLTKIIDRRVNTNYDIVFIDPPYDMHIHHIAKIVDRILSKNGMVIYFKSKNNKDQFELLNPNLKLFDQRIYGITVVDFICKK